jgi:ATP-dependent DNA helicase RecG
LEQIQGSLFLEQVYGKYVSSYPLRAVKELLFNAVIHKNYQSNAPIKFYEFSDRIEISNAGGLYVKALPENFPNENDSPAPEFLKDQPFSFLVKIFKRI